jgi:uncharacterized repeat protein (TIGR01451 family)
MRRTAEIGTAPTFSTRRRWIARAAGVSALVVGLAIAVVGSASATGTLDQSNPPPATSAGATSQGAAAQIFTAGASGLLDTVRLNVEIAKGDPGDLVVSIDGLTPGGIPNEFDVRATQTVSQSSVPTYTGNEFPSDFTNELTVTFDTPATVDVGTTYALVISSSQSNVDSYYLWGSTADGYGGGDACEISGGTPAWTCDTSRDFVFATYVSPPPSAGIAPASVSFGGQAIASTSSAQRITVTNTAASGSASLAIGQLSIGGAAAGDFALTNDTCSNAKVDPASSCSADVTFTPTAAGVRTASLAVPSNAASSPDQVALSGTGTTLADVSVQLSGPSSAKKGTQISYLITVANAGPSSAHNVVLTSPVPAGSTFVGVSTSSGTCSHPSRGASKGTISCSLGDLASGGSAGSAVSVRVTAKVGSTITDIASAYSTDNQAGPATADPDTSNNWKSLSTTIQ